MGAWDYELARELRGLGRGAGRTEILEGTVVSVSPLTVSLFGGKVMAPPAPLQTLFCAQGFYRDADSGHLELGEVRLFQQGVTQGRGPGGDALHLQL